MPYAERSSQEQTRVRLCQPQRHLAAGHRRQNSWPIVHKRRQSRVRPPGSATRPQWLGLVAVAACSPTLSQVRLRSIVRFGSTCYPAATIGRASGEEHHDSQRFLGSAPRTRKFPNLFSVCCPRGGPYVVVGPSSARSAGWTLRDGQPILSLFGPSGSLGRRYVCSKANG